MRNKCVLLRTICILVIVALLTGCVNTSTKLHFKMAAYERMISGDIPEDLRLTIYYISPLIFTRMPLSSEDLVHFPGVQKITVNAEELSSNLAVLQKLKASVLQPVEEEKYIDARIYYVFETGSSNKVLEVVSRSPRSSVFVNGIEVENNEIFYEIIEPFLTEEAHEILGI